MLFDLDSEDLTQSNLVAPNGNEVVVNFEENMDEKGGALDMSASDTARGEVSFDPASDLPPDALRRLMVQIETIIGDCFEKENKIASMRFLASVLTIWRTLENTSAEIYSCAMSGMTQKDRVIADGKRIKIDARRLNLAPDKEMGRETDGVGKSVLRFRP